MSWKPTKPPFAEYKKHVFAKASDVSEFIYQIGEYPELRKPSKEITGSASSIFKLKLQYLKDCLRMYRKLTGHGRGIAAVQVGIPETFFIVYTPAKLLVVINPKITKQSKTLLLYPEMCMSANPIIAPTVRPAWIEFDYYDEYGKLQHWKTKDDTDQGRLLNRVFQHEIDHMEGIINIDRVDSRELILESDPTFYDTATFEELP